MPVSVQLFFAGVRWIRYPSIHLHTCPARPSPSSWSNQDKVDIGQWHLVKEWKASVHNSKGSVLLFHPASVREGIAAAWQAALFLIGKHKIRPAKLLALNYIFLRCIALHLLSRDHLLFTGRLFLSSSTMAHIANHGIIVIATGFAFAGCCCYCCYFLPCHRLHHPFDLHDTVRFPQKGKPRFRFLLQYPVPLLL